MPYTLTHDAWLMQGQEPMATPCTEAEYQSVALALARVQELREATLPHDLARVGELLAEAEAELQGWMDAVSE